MKIEEQFEERDNKFFCKICEKSYKNIKKKDGKYTKMIINHYKTKCEKKRTRNIIAYKTEDDIFKHYKDKYQNKEVKKVNNRLFINGKDNKNPKADWMVGNKRVQFKKSKNVYIHNWTRTSHLEYIKREHGIDLLEELEKIVLSQETSLKRKLKSKNKRRKLKKIAILVKVVENDSKIDDILKIKDLKTKKIFVHWDKNEKDNFYYVYGDNIDKMIHMTDDRIKKMKIVYDVRSIYSDSGKTNLKMEDIFKNNEKIVEMIKRINE